MRQELVDVGGSEVVVGIGLEMTVREQQRRMRHEKGEDEMERSKTHMQQTPIFHELEPMRVCAHA